MRISLGRKMTKDLEVAILEFVTNSTRDHADRVASKIASSEPSSFSNVVAMARTSIGRERLEALMSAVKMSDVLLPEVAGILKGAALAKTHLAETNQVDLIWTGPSTSLVPTRRTEPALVEIINAAKLKLFLTSFVAYSIPTVLEALSDALSRNVEVSILLESSEAFGGGVSFDVISKMKAALPDALIYSWDQKSDLHIGGKVHAKVAVADGKLCCISSANLTTHAMEINMEAGVVVKGHGIAAKLHEHLETLVTTKVISLVQN